MERIHYKKEETVLCNIEIDSDFLKDIREIAEKRKGLNKNILGDDDEEEKMEKEEY